MMAHLSEISLSFLTDIWYQTTDSLHGTTSCCCSSYYYLFSAEKFLESVEGNQNYPLLLLKLLSVVVFSREVSGVC